jgi:HAD superfamily 5'-nucleotidase-like hydrolase
MDYTLIHYRVDEWERRAYEHLRQRLGEMGYPVAGLEFDPDAAIRGLAIDREKGNLVKANRFGYVKQASHGMSPMGFDDLRKEYGRVFVDLAEPRWEFLNTFFSRSEGCMFAQLVDRLDEGRLPGVMGYSDLYALVKRTLDFAHMEGHLKAEIIADPDRFVDLDPDLPQALADQRAAGKKVLLITNSEWSYTSSMMTYSFDRFLPGGKTWRDLFDMVFVSARKPAFFTLRMPVFEIASEEGLLRPALRLHDGGLFLGGDARLVEEHLGLSGEEILYVGDHLSTDVHVSKAVLRWRTALVVRELEDELAALSGFRDSEVRLESLMAQKEHLEHLHSHARLGLQRLKGDGPKVALSPSRLHQAMTELRAAIDSLDQQITPLAVGAGEMGHSRWGPLMRAGNDKSLMARQLERYADVYTSRVSNFLHHTPYGYLRSFRGTMPHDAGPESVPDKAQP